MLNSDLQRQQFHGRLERIRKGGPNTTGQVYVGPPEDGDAAGQAGPHFGIPATLLALGLGALAYWAGSLAQFHLMLSPETGRAAAIGPSTLAAATRFGDLAVAVPLALIALRLLRQRGLAPVAVAALGLVAAMGLHGVVVGLAPGFFAGLYSPDHVALLTGR